MENKDFVEIEGVKYQADPDNEGEALKDDEGNLVPFKESKDDDGNGGGNPSPKLTIEDIEKAELDELAKANPKVAKLLAEIKEKEKRLADIESAEEEKKRKEAEQKGEWQKLAEEERQKREEAEKGLKNSKELLSKYVGSVKTILNEVIETIPKENRGLIPKDFSPRQQLEYITQNAKLLGAKIIGAKGSPIDKSDSTPNATDEDKLVAEINTLMEKTNKTPQEYELLTQKATELKKLRAKQLTKE